MRCFRAFLFAGIKGQEKLTQEHTPKRGGYTTTTTTTTLQELIPKRGNYAITLRQNITGNEYYQAIRSDHYRDLYVPQNYTDGKITGEYHHTTLDKD